MHSSDEWAVTGLVTADFCKGDNARLFSQYSGCLVTLLCFVNNHHNFWWTHCFKHLFLKWFFNDFFNLEKTLIIPAFSEYCENYRGFSLKPLVSDRWHRAAGQMSSPEPCLGAAEMGPAGAWSSPRWPDTILIILSGIRAHFGPLCGTLQLSREWSTFCKIGVLKLQLDGPHKNYDFSTRKCPW